MSIRFFLFILAFAIPQSILQAQITITSADMPSANDTLRYSNGVFSANLPYLAAGPNQTWDFSGLSPTSQGIDQYKSSLQTPYAFFFVGINKYGRKVADSLGVAAFQFTEVYNFYRKASSVFEVEGIGLKYLGIPLPAYYSEKDKLYQFPLQFGDRDSSIFKFSINLPTLGSYSQVGYRINEVEGWGSITTPFGTFNCLKIKSSIQSADSLNIGGFPLKINRRLVEYKWLANGQKIPILEISGTLFGSTFLANTVKYRDIVRGNTLTSPPVASFSANPLQAQVYQAVTLQNTSSGNFNQYLWTITPNQSLGFENNTSDTSKNPVISFSQAGVYSVKLRASNFFGSDEELKTNYLVITDPSANQNLESSKEVYFLGSEAFAGPEWIKNAHLSLFSLDGKKETGLPIENRKIRFKPKPIIYFLRAEWGNQVFQQKIWVRP
jgi:hypothetical protein